MDELKEVKKARKGNVRSFEKLITTYKVLLYRVASSILHRDEDCADAIQEAILKAFQSIHTLREPAYFKTWLVRIVMNECHQLQRQKKNIISIEKLAEPYSNEPGFEKIEVDQLLALLPEEQQQLLKLFHIEGLTIQELSLIYEKPENTIKTRLRRARASIRESLTRQDKEVAAWKNGKNM